MAIKFAYTKQDGGVAIVHAAPKEHLERLFGPMTDAQYEAHVVERSIPTDAADVTKLPDDWTPPDDRTFRNAWKHDKGKFAIDFDRAKVIATEMEHTDNQEVAAAKDIDELRTIVAKNKPPKK